MNKIRMITGQPKTGKTYFTNHLKHNLTLDCYNDNSIIGHKLALYGSDSSMFGDMNVTVNQLISNSDLKGKFGNITIDGFDILYMNMYNEYSDFVSRCYWEQNISDDIFQMLELKFFEWISSLLSFGYDINLIIGKTTGSREIDDIYRSITRVVNCFNNRYNNVDTIHCYYGDNGEHMISINKDVMKYNDSLF